MIKYIKRAELNVEKYNACIDTAINTRIYAYAWYLDIVADNWDVLVLEDYKAVMPLPWRTKYFIKYVYPPCWTQQLGVFSATKIDEEFVLEFINNIPRKFKKVTINFNAGSLITGKNIEERVNYILALDKPYKELFINYKYVRRRGKRQLNPAEISIKQTNEIQKIILLFIRQKQSSIKINMTDYDRLEKLICYLKDKKQIDVIIAKNNTGELLGGAFFLKDNNRITYLFSAVSQQGRDKQVMTYIIDRIIEKYAESNYTLDFEGSMIEGIAFFFRSFGAEKEAYFSFQKKLNF